MTALAKIIEQIPIADEERARRKLAVERAYANNAIEGVGINMVAAPFFDQFINGEISLEELRLKIEANVKAT